MRYFLILLISFYQRFISPWKGFRCAYGCYHPGTSCSGRVKQIVAEHGVIAGWPLIWRQFRHCHDAYVALGEASARAEAFRVDPHRLLRPVRARNGQKRTLYIHIPDGARVANPREMGFVCCFFIRGGQRY